MHIAVLMHLKTVLSTTHHRRFLKKWSEPLIRCLSMFEIHQIWQTKNWDFVSLKPIPPSWWGYATPMQRFSGSGEIIAVPLSTCHQGCGKVGITSEKKVGFSKLSRISMELWEDIQNFSPSLWIEVSRSFFFRAMMGNDGVAQQFFLFLVFSVAA